MRLRKRVVNLEGAIRSGSGFRQRFACRNAGILLHHQIAISQSYITESIIRIAANRLLELLCRFSDSLHSPLVPEIAPPQVELVSLRVRRITLDQLPLLLTRQP